MESNVALSFEPEAHPVVVFIHIPKTGGTTVHYYLRRHFRRTKRLNSPNRLRKGFLDRPADKRKRWDFISGHFPIGLVHRATPRPCVYFTFFRDPLAKAVSNYNHVLRWKQHRWHGRFIEKKITTEKFLTQHDDIKDLLIDNPATRCFSDLSSFFDPQPMTPALVEQVKTRLREQFMFLGLTERSADSIFLLSRKLRLPLSPYLTHNVTRRPEVLLSSLSAEVIARFKELNWADYEVYDYAKQTFERQWGELDARERKRAAWFRLMQRCISIFTFKSPEKISYQLP